MEIPGASKAEVTVHLACQSGITTDTDKWKNVFNVRKFDFVTFWCMEGYVS